MRPPARLLNAETLALRGSLYVCSTCRQTASPRTGLLAVQQHTRQASSTTDPLTEKVRRKLWGTDNPPGLKDPYGGKGILEQKFGRGGGNVVEEAEPAEGEEHQAKSQLDVTEDEAPVAGQEEYTPALSWEGIERVGHLGRWKDLPPSEGDVYTPFKAKTPVTKRGHLNLAAHQAAVEVALLATLNKPLTAICDVVEHDKSVFKMLWKCKIQPGADGNGWTGAVVYPNKETEAALVYIFEQIGGQGTASESTTTTTTTTEAEAEAEVDQSVEALEFEPATLPFFGYTDVRDRGFLSLPLDETIKFAYLKRFSQLSGHFFPDTAMHSISSVKQVVDYIHRSLTPKPTKLADKLARKGSVLNRPNVKVFAKKQKLSDRDEELGRKKVIGAELRARGFL